MEYFYIQQQIILRPDYHWFQSIYSNVFETKAHEYYNNLVKSHPNTNFKLFHFVNKQHLLILSTNIELDFSSHFNKG